MTGMKHYPNILMPNRRELLLSAAALGAGAAIPHRRGRIVPDRQSKHHGPAVTDTEVTVGILHSVTGTMAISETGSVQAEKLAIEQINAQGRSARPQDQIHFRRTAAAIGRRLPEKAKKLLVSDRSLR